MRAAQAGASRISFSQLTLSPDGKAQCEVPRPLALPSVWARSRPVAASWCWCSGSSFFGRGRRTYHESASLAQDWRRNRARFGAFENDNLSLERSSMTTMSIAATHEGGGRQLRRRTESHVSLSTTAATVASSATDNKQSKKKSSKATVSLSPPTEDDLKPSNDGVTEIEARLWNLDKTDELTKLTVVELRAVMKHISKPTAGRKDELISEVRKWLAERQGSSTLLNNANANRLTREPSSDAESLEGALLKAERKSRQSEALSRMIKISLADGEGMRERKYVDKFSPLTQPELPEVDSLVDGEGMPGRKSPRGGAAQRKRAMSSQAAQKGYASDKDFESCVQTNVLDVKSRATKKVAKVEAAVEDGDVQRTTVVAQKRKTKQCEATVEDGEVQTTTVVSQKRKTNTSRSIQAKKGKLNEEVEDSPPREPAETIDPWTTLVHKKPEANWIPYNALSMRPPPPPLGTEFIKLVSWNVNGLRALMKDKEKKLEEAQLLSNFAKEENFDIICLQETKLQEKDIEQIRKSLLAGVFNDSFWSCSTSKLGYSGTAVLSKIKPIAVTYGMGIPDHDSEGRLITMEFDSFFLLTCYVPNSGEKLARLDYRTQAWDPALSRFIKELEKRKPVILTGDLNCANNEIDIYNPDGNRKSAGFTEQERTSFKANFLSQGLVDTFRQQHANAVGYTYWAYRSGARAKNQGWRLDYFLVSEALAGRVHDSYICSRVSGSDHCPIGLILNL